MEAVAVRFRGVESLNGWLNWKLRGPDDGSSGNREKQQKNHVDQTFANKLAEPEWSRSCSAEYEPQRKRFLSYFWRLLPHTAATVQNPVELIEFARDLSNESSAIQA